MADEKRICVGALMGAFGVHGDLRLKSFCAVPSSIANFENMTSEDGETTYDLEVVGVIKNGYAAQIEGIVNKEQADEMKGVTLWVDRDVLPNLPDDEFYHTDLIGLKVLDTGGVEIGKVFAMHDHGAGDIMELSGPEIKNTIMLPFTKKAVPTVDLTKGIVIIDPPEGLFSNEPAPEGTGDVDGFQANKSSDKPTFFD
jgi:16S rRNA processing protein RimM